MKRETDFLHRVIVICTALLPLLCSACASLETRIAEPRGRSLLDETGLVQIESALGIERHRVDRPDGPELAYRVVQPATYGMQYRFDRDADGVAMRFDFPRPPEERTPIRQRGTVVLLHGWGMDSSSMLPWAISFAERGWRAVLVDLRNHGASGRAPAGFGPREGRDVAALIAGLLPDDGNTDQPLALFGVSYGAVAALYAAGHASPRQVDAVIAMSPFANAADGVRGMIQGMAALPARGFRDRLARVYVRGRYSEARIDRAIAGAGRRLGIDLADINVRDAAAAVVGCALFLHGSSDGFFPMEAVQSLAETAPRGELVRLAGEHHFTAPMRVDWLADPLAGWLDGATAGHCPSLALPGPGAESAGQVEEQDVGD